jgi:hypothetical protein
MGSTRLWTNEASGACTQVSVLPTLQFWGVIFTLFGMEIRLTLSARCNTFFSLSCQVASGIVDKYIYGEQLYFLHSKRNYTLGSLVLHLVWGRGWLH